jgi:hypothetical protein
MLVKTSHDLSIRFDILTRSACRLELGYMPHVSAAQIAVVVDGLGGGSKKLGEVRC